VAQDPHVGKRANCFNDPFLQVTDGIAECPVPEGPMITESEMKAEAHSRTERGTRCFLSGRCRLAISCLYDKEIIPRVKKAIVADGRFAFFQALAYLGLQATTAINAVLLNSSAPLFMLLCSWMIEREAASARQLTGVLISLVGIFTILAPGDAATLLRLEFHSGDGWIVLAMPIWGVYSVLLKHLPPELRGTDTHGLRTRDFR
jgi:hypothetical protein